MTREVTRRLVAAATAAALTTLTACSSNSAADHAPASSTSSSPSVTSAGPQDKHKPAGRATPGVPTPGSLEKPATSSGPLSQRSLPTPKQLGPGWSYAVDNGDAEEGYAGNGTPSLARGPREIVQTAVPFGCPRRSPMPLPAHALEVDYTLHGAKVIAVRTSFDSSTAARGFFTGRAANLRACLGRASGVAIGTLVARLTEPAPAALANDRTPTSDPWRELAVLDAHTVVFVAIQGKDPLTPPRTRRLVRLLRS